MKTSNTIVLSILISFFTINSFGQKIISGYVTDETNNVLKGAIVSAKDNSVGIRTDSKGYYTISSDSMSTILVFSFPGMVTQIIEVSNQQIVNVTLVAEKVFIQEKTGIQTFAGAVQGMAPYKSGKSRTSTNAMGMAVQYPDTEYNTEDYSTIHESGFKNTITDPLSTFSIDVDNASYTNIRRFINMGQLPPKDAIRVEEMINYFDYSYSQPINNDPISITTEYSVCPWNSNHQLVLVGMQGKKIETDDLPPSNLIFLIDVSGSMSAANKLPLIQSSLKMLTNNLRPQDKVAIVVYAGAAGVVLESTPGSNKKKITEAINNLKAGGSTAGGEGLTLAYKIASENFLDDGNNRIIVTTDGDFNVGQSSDSQMERLVEKQRNNNIFLTVLGFGMGNYKDNKLETIANNGNGNFAYIDNSQEAHKVFIKEFGGTLFTIAKDVKFQLEFNPKFVKEYRLVGYENRALNNEDFKNDKKDAGELGSGQQVTALYEIIPTNSNTDLDSDNTLKYQKRRIKNDTNLSNEILTIKVRYKHPKDNSSLLMTHILTTESYLNTSITENIKQAAAISQFGMLLRGSEFKGNSTIASTIALLESIGTKDSDGYRGELIRLAKTAESLGLNIQHTL
ncbi:MAG: von Willebrand factor type A domain-containing protein [Prolixibacteraceae bacterium]|jgi:Ca-activated chloride channel family protein|nr:von Willebrand factor type A domain-containing protein [Prolixibacteraceae bacterium]